MRRLFPALVLACICCACDGPAPANSGDPGLDVTVGTISAHLSTGAVVTSGAVLTFTVSDAADSCLALTNVPVQAWTRVTLAVSARADGTNAASVVARKAVPNAGEAVGGISRSVGGTPTASYDAASGSVAWTSNSNGTVTVTALDLGFAGATERLTVTTPLTLQHCP